MPLCCHLQVPLPGGISTRPLPAAQSPRMFGVVGTALPGVLWAPRCRGSTRSRCPALASCRPTPACCVRHPPPLSRPEACGARASLSRETIRPHSQPVPPARHPQAPTRPSYRLPVSRERRVLAGPTLSVNGGMCAPSAAPAPRVHPHVRWVFPPGESPGLPAKPVVGVPGLPPCPRWLLTPGAPPVRALQNPGPSPPSLGSSRTQKAGPGHHCRGGGGGSRSY